ncbi:DNA polymerase III subunit beta [Mesorhizobium mediterraneum]|jgi:DNA polymerase III subunit beta|uniref:Beta sliding clamp n=1 Tax=Mesorhizobium mediterraneum TaxID=43617 RepID=A0AB36R3G2_9HYPH|nr:MULTISPECIES: DNA polymerase III subunit beta [Mesorhizobium]PAP99293.1 DNA polymerase III subunit beta [Mesorhizobium mediterraneum]RUU30330.1 DNA polymerase III subunit beta [Mesorhizobium sp. M6A.T.Ce.TU.016.01.1.1]RUU47255.1 DNA polymerase III subunit beta [Mesorhizobium sp. M6A.T.Ce.TU.002.03.1.1]RVB71491.1 DNA polymerase III subunit beta [Mesorhizobium sp. M6A.T.Cr.TU.014.01.1.1]RWN38115.1 MAG: DNA polymerase III subunit beta [Mesorhizobium sp.]
MRVILERSNLLKSLNHVHRVVERRNTIPILSNVLLSAEGATLEMKATDLDLEVTEATPAKVERGGATTVPAHLLYDIVRKLADGAEVMLKTDEDGNAMTVTSGRSSFRLQCLPQSDFPELSAGSFSHIFRLDSVALRGLIEKTQFAISTEETRYYLNGIYLHTHDADGKLKLRSVATDGHRLARAEIDAPAGSEGMPGIIIPRKTVSELQKLVDDPDIAVTTELSDTKIRFTIGSVVLTSKLIDGTFPDYQRVIPTGNDKKLIIDRQSFAAAVDRVSTISSERGRAVKLSIGEGQVTLAVNNPDSGSATEELAADYSSDAIEIGFNAKYLLDVAAQLTGTEAKFMLADAGSPTLIHDMADETTLYVLMPMRV